MLSYSGAAGLHGPVGLLDKLSRSQEPCRRRYGLLQILSRQPAHGTRKLLRLRLLGSAPTNARQLHKLVIAPQHRPSLHTARLEGSSYEFYGNFTESSNTVSCGFHRGIAAPTGPLRLLVSSPISPRPLVLLTLAATR